MNLEQISNAILQEQGRAQRSARLTQAADLMRKKGASESSVRIALTGLNEFLKPIKPCKSEHSGRFSLSQDLDLLEAVIKRFNAVLVIIDPLMAVVGCSSTTSCNSCHVLFSLAQLAERTGCAILLIRSLNTRQPRSSRRSNASHCVDRGLVREIRGR